MNHMYIGKMHIHILITIYGMYKYIIKKKTHYKLGLSLKVHLPTRNVDWS